MEIPEASVTSQRSLLGSGTARREAAMSSLLTGWLLYRLLANEKDLFLP